MSKLTPCNAALQLCLLLHAALLLFAASCSAGSGRTPLADNPIEPGNVQAEVSFPAALPVDALLPWEELSPAGYAVDPTRNASSINAESIFSAGVDTFEAGGSTSAEGRALNVNSAALGSEQLSYAMYRLPLEGEPASIVSVDVNLAERSDGSRSEYYVALADYGNGRWKTYGPFTDSHVRIPLPQSGSFASPLGNLFAALLAWDGSGFSIVGVGVNTESAGDTIAPPAPAAPQLSAVNGGLLLEWLPVAASDLAGYRIYYRSESFIDQLATGVKSVPYIEGLERHLLSDLTGETFVRISAVDTSGNESALSPLASGTPLGGSAGSVLLSVEATDVLLNDSVTLTATGAESYDFDLDGDGDFDITGNTSGVVEADTSALGLIRPTVRGSSDGGVSVALGGVSLIVSVNIPPVAILAADALQGRIHDGEANPFSINFDATQSYDQDGESLEYAFDLNADGTLGAFNSNPLRTGEYSTQGVFYVGLSVRDAGGLVDNAAVAITIHQVSDMRQRMVRQGYINCSTEYFSIADISGHPAIAYLDSTGLGGLKYCRAHDPQGNVWGEVVTLDDANGSSTGLFADLKMIAGRPAVAYVDTVANELRYIRCGSATGQYSTDWSLAPVDVDSSVNPSSRHIDLEYISGNPAVAWGQGPNLEYVRASGASGTGDLQSDWTNPSVNCVINPSNFENGIGLELVNGRPAVVAISAGSLLYKRANTANGASALDWPNLALDIDGGINVLSHCDFKTVNGNPAVAFFSSVPVSTIQYLRATSPDGGSIDDWTQPVAVYTGSEYSTMGFINLESTVAGPVVTHYRSSNATPFFEIIRSNDINGSSWGTGSLAGGLNDMPITSYSSLCVVDELPVLLLQSGSTMILSSPDLLN